MWASAGKELVAEVVGVGGGGGSIQITLAALLVQPAR